MRAKVGILIQNRETKKRIWYLFNTDAKPEVVVERRRSDGSLDKTQYPTLLDATADVLDEVQQLITHQGYEL